MTDKVNNVNAKPNFFQRAADYVKEQGHKVSIWLDSHGNNDGEFTMQDIVVITTGDANKIIDSMDEPQVRPDFESGLEDHNDEVQDVEHDVNDDFTTDFREPLTLKNDAVAIGENNLDAQELKFELSGEPSPEEVAQSKEFIYEMLYSEHSDITCSTEDDSITVVRRVLPDIIGAEALCNNNHELKFTFSRTKMEDYVINAKNQPRFRNIREIQSKFPEMRTQKEADLLEEFNNMLNYVIDAGMKYGVDPKLILSIIHQEVKFDGVYGKNITGVNGKGYMQITSSPVSDFLGGDSSGQYQKKNKINILGPEMAELLKSRGFNIDCDVKDKPQLLSDIMDYLIENKDIEFNIKLGTLILRRKLVMAKGNPRNAAYKYNNNGKPSKENPSMQVRELYAMKVNKYYRILCDS